MKTLLIALLAFAAAGPALATEANCNIPEADRQPPAALESKLKADGWDVRSVKVEAGCYEAYAIDADGNKVEAVFDPKTLARVDSGETGEESED
jgi:hypothetical protein